MCQAHDSGVEAKDDEELDIYLVMKTVGGHRWLCAKRHC